MEINTKVQGVRAFLAQEKESRAETQSEVEEHMREKPRSR